MGGNQVPGQGSGDDGWDEEGYDESQRAEILETLRDGPSDGVLLTDLDPDIEGEDGDDPEDDALDDLKMRDDEVGETDDDVTMDEDDIDEDDAQDAFDDGVEDDEDLDDGDDVALKP